MKTMVMIGVCLPYDVGITPIFNKQVNIYIYRNTHV